MIDDRKKEIAGWLALLTLILMVLSPLLTALGTITTILHLKPNPPSSDALAVWAAMKNILWGFFLAKSALWITAGYRLRHKLVPSSPRFAGATLWLAGPICSLAQIYSLRAVSGVEGSLPLASSDTTSLLLSALWAAIWTGYLFCARRVRVAYFGATKDD